jgi:ribonuclease Z
MIEVTILGTSSMVPTKERNQSGLFIGYGTQGILVDCGEGTQRQLKLANISLTKVTKILISHWHGDHVLGLPGLIQSLAASEYDKKLEIYGPKGTKKHFEHMFQAFVFDRNLDMEIKEIEEGVLFESKDFCLEALPLKHGVASLGYVFQEKDRRKIMLDKAKKLGVTEGPLLRKIQEGKDITVKGKKIKAEEISRLVKGKRIGIITDTAPCDNCYKIAQDADLLISESTYASKFKEKSEEYNHMTSKDAALIASKAKAKRLILTHFSARYKSTLELNEDASNYFPDTECAYDLMKIRV